MRLDACGITLEKLAESDGAAAFHEVVDAVHHHGDDRRVQQKPRPPAVRCNQHCNLRDRVRPITKRPSLNYLPAGSRKEPRGVAGGNRRDWRNGGRPGTPRRTTSFQVPPGASTRTRAEQLIVSRSPATLTSQTSPPRLLTTTASAPCWVVTDGRDDLDACPHREHCPAIVSLGKRRCQPNKRRTIWIRVEGFRLVFGLDAASCGRPRDVLLIRGRTPSNRYRKAHGDADGRMRSEHPSRPAVAIPRPAERRSGMGVG
jgi:hypothetical protein